MAQSNLINLVLEDHKTAKDKLNTFLDGPETAREQDFCQLVHDLVAHEVAEEVVVYPAFRREVAGSADVVDARIAEQNEAESLLAKMERLDVQDAEFTSLFNELRTGVLDHARLEEETVFAPLSVTCSEADLIQLGEEYRRAKEAAPTHPHPHVPGGTKAGAALVGLADRARDAIQATLAPESNGRN